MAVMAVVLAAIIAAVAWFLIRRRKRSQPRRVSPTAEMEGTIPRPRDRSPSLQKQEESETGTATASELDTKRQSNLVELPSPDQLTQREKMDLGDERVAKGYDGAYRGN